MIQLVGAVCSDSQRVSKVIEIDSKERRYSKPEAKNNGFVFQNGLKNDEILLLIIWYWAEFCRLENIFTD